MEMRTLSIALLFVIVTSLASAQPAQSEFPDLPVLPDQAGDVAFDVLEQLGAGIIPPEPQTPGGGFPVSEVVLPELPDEASDIARDVLQQLGAGIIPPEPQTPGGIPPASTAVLSDVPVSTATIPEPATLSLLALGGLAILRRRRK